MAKHKKRKYTHRQDYNDYEPTPALSDETKKGIFIVLLFVIAFITVFALFDLAGALGIYVKQGLGATFGWGIYLLPVILILLAYFLLRPEKYEVKPSNYLGLILFIFSYLGILQLIKGFEQVGPMSGNGGGFLGYFASYPFYKLMGSLATTLIMVALFIISLLITFNTSLNSLVTKLNLLDQAKKKMSRAEKEYENEDEEEGGKSWINEEEEEKEEEDLTAEAESGSTEEKNNNDEQTASREQTSFIKKKVAEDSAKKNSKNIPEGISVTFAKGRSRKVEVPLSLLDSKTSKPTSGDIKANMEKIQATLENFGIEVTMDEVNVGPTVTQFTLKPTDGVKISNIVSLQNDLALALAAHPIRIEAPIPGKSLVGIEIPNQSIATVRLKEILVDKKFKKKKNGLIAALGKDVSGNARAVDLTESPHLLIAGATGSGKSVCINSVIISLLFNNSPEQLKLILIDPKRVELTAYNGLPHLLTPVITDVKKTVNALCWAVREMDERYKLLEATKKRNIAAYNASVITNRLPYIVIIIDELADLMAVAPKEIEAAIVRLAQMARAIGIHLVVATQRPSVNIITGLIKANITSRIAFAVASSIDSRTILDFSGAEKLLGKGDMLYISANLSKPKRIQGALVIDDEIERVADFWRGQGEPEYADEVTEKQTKVNLPGSSMDGDNGDELLEEAKDIILTSGKASASFLQRRLRVGYARAARLLDLLEERGIIGPSAGAKPREILVNESVVYGETLGGQDYSNNKAEEINETDEEETEENENEKADEDEEDIIEDDQADSTQLDEEDEPNELDDEIKEEEDDQDRDESGEKESKIKINYQ